MRHDSIEWVYVPVVGTTGWHVGAAAGISRDGGTTWKTGEITSATSTRLADGRPGTRALVRVMSTALAPLVAGQHLELLAQVTVGGETAVLPAGPLYIE